MNNECITIVASFRYIAVVSGRQKRARLEWQAPGLDIYLLGSAAKCYDIAANVAMNECIARHIPLVACRRVASGGGAK